MKTAIGCEFFVFYNSFSFYNLNFELQKTVADLRKSLHRTAAPLAQHFFIMFYLLEIRLYGSKWLIYVIGKTRFRVLIAKKLFEGEIEYLTE